MKLPVRFPADDEIIAEEAKRFRSLSSGERMELIRGMLEAGALMLHNSPRSAFLSEYTAQQEAEYRRAVTEFLARHAH